MTKRFKRVGVLMGGLSSEREVSLKTGAGVRDALVELGYDTVTLDWAENASVARQLEEAKVDAVWLALHGTWGEDGCIQGLLECLRIPYTGSGVLASALAMDKVMSKKVFNDHAIDTPPWTVLSEESAASAPWQAWGWPLVVKPSREGSSVGVTLAQDANDFATAIESARNCRGKVIIERYIPGLEIHVAVLSGKVLGEVEVRTAAKFYDYEAKYVRNDTQYLVPAPIDDITRRRCHDVAARAFAAFGCEGHARVDIRVDPDGTPYVLEVNTLPGMTSRSLVPKIAAAAGVSYANLVERILLSAALHE